MYDIYTNGIYIVIYNIYIVIYVSMIIRLWLGHIDRRTLGQHLPTLPRFLIVSCEPAQSSKPRSSWSRPSRPILYKTQSLASNPKNPIHQGHPPQAKSRLESSAQSKNTRKYGKKCFAHLRRRVKMIFEKDWGDFKRCAFLAAWSGSPQFSR